MIGFAPGFAPTSSPRVAVARALVRCTAQYPDLDPPRRNLFASDGLESRDAALALAIYRTCLQRWISIEYLLNRYLRRGFDQLEPPLQAVLLSAGAQLLFFDRVPCHAVVDESVELARKLVRPKAAPLVNAVLRRLSSVVLGARSGADTALGADRLPREGGYIQLRTPLLPPPRKHVEHLSVASSHPRHLVKRWIDAFGLDQARRICLHGIKNPPILVATEDGFQQWTRSHRQLVEFLTAHPARRVQDPAAASAVASTRQLAPRRIIDYCAGLGTKTRQLAWLHRDAQVWASDRNHGLLGELRSAVGPLPQVSVTEAADLPQAVELVVLDVPCSNTAVLARRPEARYRFSTPRLERLLRLQSHIADQALSHLMPGGTLLYCTCSLEREENQQQVAHLSSQHGLSVVDQQVTLPDGSGQDYHDGSFYALLAKGSAG